MNVFPGIRFEPLDGNGAMVDTILNQIRGVMTGPSVYCAMCVEAFLAFIWITTFTFFVHMFDDNCTNSLLPYGNLVIQGLIILLIVQIILVAGAIMCASHNSTIGLIIFIGLAIITSVLGVLYLWISGIMVIRENTPIQGCGGLFYLTEIFLLVVSIQIGCNIFTPIIGCLCVFCFTKMLQ